jgi:hypothetical protein
MFELYEIDTFIENIENGNFIEISILNRYKDFKSIHVFIGRKYKDIFIPYGDKVYTGCSKKITIEDTISYFYNIEKEKIMLSTYRCNPEREIKKLNKVAKWSWKSFYESVSWAKLNFLHL